MLTKGRVRSWLERNFFLRIHMTLILGGTFLAGLVATKLLTLAGLNTLALRYALAVVAAYLVFLALIRLWMAYVRSGGIDFTGAGIDAAGDVFAWSLPTESTSAELPGGGSFGGGSGSSSSSSFGLDLDGDVLLVVIVFVALVVGLAAASIYVIYSAPMILTEALFEAALAAALVRRARKVERGWVGAVWRATFWPFVAILMLTALLGWAAQRACPEAVRLSEVFDCPTSPSGTP